MKLSFNKCIHVHIRNTDNDKIPNNIPGIMVISNIAIITSVTFAAPKLVNAAGHYIESVKHSR